MESVEVLEVLERISNNINDLKIIEGYLKNIASMNYTIMLGLAIVGIMYLFYRFLKIFV